MVKGTVTLACILRVWRAELRLVKAGGRARERVEGGRLSFGSLARAMYLRMESKGWSGRRASRANEELLASESISSVEKPIVASAFNMLLLMALMVSNSKYH